MKFLDRVRETTTTTGTGAFVLAGAVAGSQSFAGYAVGERVPYCAALGAEWEVGVGTKAATTIERTTVTASSNGGALVNFSAGVKELYVNAGAAMLALVVDPMDTGFDIVLCAGQSNMVGLGTRDANIDVADPRVFQFGCYPTETASYNKIVSGVDPLRHPYENAPGISPASWFSKTYAGVIPSNRKVLLVPVAKGGTHLVAQTAEWAPGNPGGVLYELAISQTNAAIAAAKVMYPNSRFVGTIWRQGESDGDWTISTTNYANALKALIAGFRSRIAGAGVNDFFVMGGVVPEAIAARAGYPAINAAHLQVANETARCSFVADIAGSHNGDSLHSNAHAQRVMGCKMASQVFVTALNMDPVAVAEAAPADVTAPTLTSPTSASTGQTTGSGAVTTNEANGTLYCLVSVNATETAATVKASGATQAVTTTGSKAVTVSGLTASTTYYLHFVHRDAAGNDSALVTSASFMTAAVGDTTAPTLSAPTGTQTSSTTASGSVTTNEANGTLYRMASVNAVESAATVKAAALTTAVTATGAQAVSFAGLSASTTYYAHYVHRDAAGNDSTVASSVSFITPAAAGGGSGALRFAQLADMTETSATPPYAYSGAGGLTYNAGKAQGGTSILALAADGSVTFQIGNGQGKPMLALKTASTPAAYTALPFLLFANTSGYEKMGGAGTAGTTGVVPAAGDLMRLTRTGTSLVAAVSKDGGTTWTTIYTWAAVAAGVMYAQILVELAGTITNPVGVGFA